MRCLPQGSYSFWTYFDPLVYSRDCIINSVYFYIFSFSMDKRNAPNKSGARVKSNAPN